MRQVPLRLLTVGCFAVLSGVACSRHVSPPAAPSPSKNISLALFPVGVSLASLDGPRRAQMKADIEAAVAKHPDIRLVIYDAQNDAARQQKQIEEFVDAHVRAIIVSPVDAQALTEPAAKAFEAGIPVVVLDRALIGDKYSCFIAADWTQIGAEAGKWLAHRLRGKGKIIEIKGPVDSLPAQQLHEAFRAALREPGYHFVFDGLSRSAQSRRRQVDGRGPRPRSAIRRRVRLRRRGRLRGP